MAGKVGYIITATSVVVSLLVMGGCARISDGSLGEDLFRKTPKEDHEYLFPKGHHKDTAFGGERDCYYDINHDVYWCQYPKPKLPDK